MAKNCQKVKSQKKIKKMQIQYAKKITIHKKIYILRLQFWAI